jgi:hypothetical protein
VGLGGGLVVNDAIYNVLDLLEVVVVLDEGWEVGLGLVVDCEDALWGLGRKKFVVG